MHEMSIALNIINLATDFAQKENAHVIERIQLDVGTLSGVLIDSLSFCFDAASKNTIVENAELVINAIPAKGNCTDCNNHFDVEQWPSPCPQCGGYFITVSSGKELKVKSITIN